MKNQTIKYELDKQETLSKIKKSELAREKAQKDLIMNFSEQALSQELTKMKVEMQAVKEKSEAITPHLIAALQAFGDKALAEKMAESMAPLSIIGGKSIAEVFSNLLKGTVLEKVLESYKVD